MKFYNRDQMEEIEKLRDELDISNTIIKRLEERIEKLETWKKEQQNPFIFKIGEKVHVLYTSGKGMGEGIVVSMRRGDTWCGSTYNEYNILFGDQTFWTGQSYLRPIQPEQPERPIKKK